MICVMRAAGTLLLLLTLVGCSGESPRKPVFGTIAGAEGRQGSILFIPAPGTDGPTGQATIVGGKFQCTTENGPLPGQHDARILLEPLAGGSAVNVTNPNPKVKASASEDFNALPLDQFTVPVTISAEAPYQVEIALPEK